MQCLYCHEVIYPEGQSCPKCGLPLDEDAMLLNVAHIGDSASPQWTWPAVDVKKFDRRILFIVAIALGIGLSVGLVGASLSDRQPASVRREPVTPYSTPAPVAPAVDPTTGSVVEPTGATLGTTPGAVPAPVGPPAPGATAEPGTMVAAADAPLPEEAPPLPLPRRPRVRARARPAPPPPIYIPQPMPPPHVLAMNPYKARGPEYILVFPAMPTIGQVSDTPDVASGGPVRVEGTGAVVE
jgi:hypothetical protein